MSSTVSKHFVLLIKLHNYRYLLKKMTVSCSFCGLFIINNFRNIISSLIIKMMSNIDSELDSIYLVRNHISYIYTL